MNDVDVCVFQDAADALCRWAEVSQLSISTDKCSVFNIGKCVPYVPISINSAILPYVTSCRDLGITVTSDLAPSTHVNIIIVKAHQRANAIHNNNNNNANICIARLKQNSSGALMAQTNNRCFVLRNVELLVRA